MVKGHNINIDIHRHCISRMRSHRFDDIFCTIFRSRINSVTWQDLVSEQVFCIFVFLFYLPCYFHFTKLSHAFNDIFRTSRINLIVNIDVFMTFSTAQMRLTSSNQYHWL